MTLLHENPELSQRQLSDALGVSLGAVNYCLRALVSAGDVKIRNFRASDNKRRYAYMLTPHGLQRKSALAAEFLKRKLREYHALKAEIEALTRDMGAANSPTRALRDKTETRVNRQK